MSLVAEYDGKAKPVAGGTDFFTGLKAAIHPQYPQAVVDLKTIDDLAYIKEDNHELVLGGMTRLNDIVNSRVIKDKFPA